jgi:ABC-type Fe3+/spermidine/putrescine transport system ATPase subunit
MLELKDIRKTYAGKPLLDGISLAVEDGEILSLLGPSGSGKSTLLRIAAGLEDPDAGKVLWNGVEITGLPAHRRGFGLMFQDYALFPHLDVFENAAFGLRTRRLPAGVVRRETEAALERVGMAEFARRKVGALSGGEQQRVALARALAPRPRLLMLDEPLGALDRALREELAGQLRRLLRELRIPSVYVTHDQEEAFTIARRIALLHAGRIEQSGSQDDLTDRPASAWAAEFLGLGTVLPGRVRGTRPLRIETAAGIFAARTPGKTPAADQRGFVLVPARGGTLRAGGKDSRGVIRGIVAESVRRGGTNRIALQTRTGAEFIFFAERGPREGEEADWRPAEGVWLER